MEKYIAAAEKIARTSIFGLEKLNVSFRVNFIEISGPFNANTKPLAASLNKIFVCREHTRDCERRIVASLARRACGGVPTAREVADLLTLASDNRKRGGAWEKSVGVAIEAMLVSPNFLFRIERDPKRTAGRSGAHHRTIRIGLAAVLFLVQQHARRRTAVRR